MINPTSNIISSFIDVVSYCLNQAVNWLGRRLSHIINYKNSLFPLANQVQASSQSAITKSTSEQKSISSSLKSRKLLKEEEDLGLQQLFKSSVYESSQEAREEKLAKNESLPSQDKTVLSLALKRKRAKRKSKQKARLGTKNQVVNSKKTEISSSNGTVQNTSPVKSVKNERVSVPAKGDCLFLSVLLGLRERYPNDSEIQNLTAKKLREITADYLQSHYNDDELLKLALLFGIEDHNRAMSNAIHDSKATIHFLNSLESGNDFKEMDKEEKKQILQNRSKNIEKEQRLIELCENYTLKEGDIEAYLQLTRNNYIIWGCDAHLVALNGLYRIPIETYTSLDKNAQPTNQFNQYPQEKHAPIKIFYTGNHYDYIRS
jgi:hypothetical protein